MKYQNDYKWHKIEWYRRNHRDKILIIRIQTCLHDSYHVKNDPKQVGYREDDQYYGQRADLFLKDVLAARLIALFHAYNLIILDLQLLYQGEHRPGEKDKENAEEAWVADPHSGRKRSPVRSPKLLRLHHDATKYDDSGKEEPVEESDAASASFHHFLTRWLDVGLLDFLHVVAEHLVVK